MKPILTFLLLTFSILCKAQTPLNTSWGFQGVSGPVLKFKNGKTYNTHLYALKYIGQIPNGSKAPFLIFSGRDCDECDANISIYIHSPANGVLKVDEGANRYEYPGKERDYEDKTLVLEGRAFYGQVLKNTIGVIWYQKELMDNKTWQKSIYLVKIDKGKQTEIGFKNWNQLDETLTLLKSGFCTEIKGMDYTTEP